jgi:hypothetical protein
MNRNVNNSELDAMSIFELFEQTQYHGTDNLVIKRFHKKPNKKFTKYTAATAVIRDARNRALKVNIFRSNKVIDAQSQRQGTKENKMKVRAHAYGKYGIWADDGDCVCVCVGRVGWGGGGIDCCRRLQLLFVVDVDVDMRMRI